ncbi:MAG TPA: MdtA/MuxA family multidrug efflux RND transporter periplasmic adaptor subunit [Thermoanaerobaculia bacterium]|nr:MdtA/MuxA family multidrug efflux RND transporter periplasmic adaptor subunit [Thermoanaerobaculia bacterium]
MEPQPHRLRWLPWVLGLAAVAVLVYFLLPSSGQGQPKNGAAAGGKGGKGAATPAVPVLASAAHTGDVGVYVTGLGTVTPLATVTVRSRVDGQLLRLAFREGQVVRAGDLLAELDPRPFQVQLMQAEGQMGKDVAALNNAELDLHRYEVLSAEDSIPKQQLDTQRATVSQIKAAIESDRGQIESAKLNLVYSRVTAPIAGRVGLRLTDPGNIVHANDANGIVVITQLQPITVIFTIPADRLPQVMAHQRSGQPLVVDAFDRDLRNQLATGSLWAVDNQIDPSTGTVRLKALFDNVGDQLFANQFVNARLLVDTLRGAVIVPSAAIQRSPQSAFVYVVKPDSTVDARNVAVALTEGDDTALQRGVAAGEMVVVDGVDKLRPGMKVAAAPATPARSRAASSGAPGAPGISGASAGAPGTAATPAAGSAPAGRPRSAAAPGGGRRRKATS